MHIKLEVRFPAGEELLAGHIITPSGETQPRILFLHGGGESTKERLVPFAIDLAERGLASFAFDFSGHGQSSGELKASSLSKRTQEATAALAYLRGPKPYVVCGSSMGGHIALELLRTQDIDTLILFAPAMFDRDAFSVPFGCGFTEIIRRDGSWKRADVLEALERFRGNLLIYVGENDAVIPQGVIELMGSHSPHVRAKEIIRIPQLGHSIPVWMAEEPEQRKKIVDKLIGVIGTS